MVVIKKLITLLFQCIWTSIVMFLIYMVAALLDVYEGGIPETIAFIIFQPLFGILLVASTMAACIIVGLPIRMHKRINSWWLANQMIPGIGLSVGLGLAMVSFHPHLVSQKLLVIDGSSVTKAVPNVAVAVTGWCLMTFCLLHIFPNWLMNVLRRFSNIANQ